MARIVSGDAESKPEKTTLNRDGYSTRVATTVADPHLEALAAECRGIHPSPFSQQFFLSPFRVCFVGLKKKRLVVLVAFRNQFRRREATATYGCQLFNFQ